MLFKALPFVIVLCDLERGYADACAACSFVQALRRGVAPLADRRLWRQATASQSVCKQLGTMLPCHASVPSLFPPQPGHALEAAWRRL